MELTDRQRMALDFHEGGLSYAAIAIEMGTSIPAAHRLVKRALTRALRRESKDPNFPSAKSLRLADWDLGLRFDRTAKDLISIATDTGISPLEALTLLIQCERFKSAVAAGARKVDDGNTA